MHTAQIFPICTPSLECKIYNHSLTNIMKYANILISDYMYNIGV